MPAVRATIEAVHLSFLGLWGGAIAATGLAAAVAFPTMKRLDPSLPRFSSYPSDHWRIAAGQVMNPVFHAVDAAGLVASGIGLVAIALLAARGELGGRIAASLRVVGVIGAAGIAVYSFGVLRPQMDGALAAFLDAAAAGDADLADAHRRDFDALHPRASFLLSANLIAVLIALGAGAWAGVYGAGGGRKGDGA